LGPPSADTIAAIATAPGRGAIGVVRVSGPAAATLAKGLIGKALPARQAVHARFQDRSGVAIDEGLALFFPGPHSYTGEDVLELQGHGGPAVLSAVLARCLELGARVADPGEFTRRAFLNEKLDLAQAEGVADLIEATSGAAARSAVRSLQGEFSERIDGLFGTLTELRVLAEASLDFPDEGDVDVLQAHGVLDRLAQVRQRLDAVRAAARRGSLLREGIHVAIVGPPNVGKSSLLNRLAGDEIAIVTEIPGTTRDTLRATVMIEGVPFHVVDTAGLREALDPVETIGIARGQAAAARADVVLVVTECGTAPVEAVGGGHRVEVENKIDLQGVAATVDRGSGSIRVRVSARTGAGLEQLRAILLEVAGWTQSGEEGAFMARARHLEALQEAATRLEQAAKIGAGRAELFAEELRYAQEALTAITGRMSSDDLLGQIFSRFCIGK
jgi:tRNA modification GTPase